MENVAPQEVCEVFSTFMVSGYNSHVLNYLYKEVFCHKIYHFQSLTRKPLIIDCGANIGMSILYFKTIFPDSEIIAFEPNPFAFRLLEKNIEANGVRDISLHNVALYDEEAEVFLHIGNNNLATPIAGVNKERIGLGDIRVSAKKLSNFIRNLRSIDLIKLDVEGAEARILNDLVESGLLRKAEQYIVEFHQKEGLDNMSFPRFLEKFKDNGFDCKIIVDTPEDKAIMLDFHKRALKVSSRCVYD